MLKIIICFCIALFTVSNGYAWDFEALIIKKKISSYKELDTAILPYVEKINGLNRKYLAGKKIIIPLSLSAAKAYCPVIKYNKDFAKYDSIMVVSKADAYFAVYSYGKLIRWGPVTYGASGKSTPTGTFFTATKERHKRSKKYHNTPMPFAQQLRGNIFIHQGPIVGKRASHGCIRLLRDDAEWFFYWSPLKFQVEIIENSLIDSVFYNNFLSKL